LKRKVMISVAAMLVLLAFSPLIMPLHAPEPMRNTVEESSSLNRDSLAGTVATHDIGEKKSSTNGNSLSHQIDGILGSGKLVFLYFYKEGCYACRLQKPLIEELEREYSDEIVFIHVNGLENRKAMAEFGVRGFPTMFLISGRNEEGYEYVDFEGYTEMSMLKSNIENLVFPVSESIDTQESTDLPHEMASPTLVEETEPEYVVPTEVHGKDCADCDNTLASHTYGTSEEAVAPTVVEPHGYHPVGAPSNVALFQDSNPWGYTAIEDLLIANGISYDVYNSANMGVVDLSPYDKVITASVQGDKFWDALEANKVWFENYTNAGGVLEMHLCAMPGSNSPGKIYPGGFVFYYTLIEEISIVASTHHILNAPNVITDDELDNWVYSAHGWFSKIPTGATEVLEATTNGKPVFAIKKFGSGTIYATTQTVEWRAGHGYPEFLENMILYPPKTYYCSTCAGCNKAIANAGPGDIVKLTDDILDRIGSCISIANTKVTFDGGGHIIDGDGVDEDYGVRILWSKNTVRNCKITDFYYGIYLLDTGPHTIIRNEVGAEKAPNSYGIYLASCSRILVQANLVGYNKYFGIYMVYGGENSIIENEVIAHRDPGSPTTYYSGIYFGWGSTHNTIERNILRENNWGIYVGYTDTNTIRQNDASNNLAGGIFLGAESLDNTVDNNRANSNGLYGIWLLWANRNTLTRNTANYNRQYGIWLSSSSDNQVVNNIANYNSGELDTFGMRLDDGSNDNNVTLNSISYNGGLGGLGIFRSSYNYIMNNTVLHNNYYGVWIRESHDIYVWWNTFSFNRHGIYLVYTTYFIWIAGNRIESNQEYGIRLEHCNYTYIWPWNKVYSNKYGIYLWGNSDWNYIGNNQIISNTQHGVHFEPNSNNCTLTENVICRSLIDIKDLDANSGDENTCSTPDGWDDDGTTGCTYSCPSGWCYDYTISDWINPPETDNWLVDHVIECNDTIITLNGNLWISEELRFNNVKLMMNVTSMGQYEIEVRPGGAFYINSKDGFPSIITNGLSMDIYYTFTIESGASAFEMRNSELHNCGWAWNLPNLNMSGLWIAADNVIMEDNLIDNNFVGMVFYHSSNHIIFNNTINSNGLHGIFGLNSHNNVITYNKIQYNGKLPYPIGFAGDGILLNQTSNSIITHNTITSNSKGNGIELIDAPNSTITNNVVELNSYNGIYLSQGPGSVVMHNLVNPNVGSRVGYSGIVVSSCQDTRIFNNTANWNNYHGISLSGSPFSNVTENNANRNGWTGIDVSSAESTRIINNTADQNGWDGISLSGSPGSTITDNTPDYNGECGIRVTSHSDNTWVTRNIANYNDHGICVLNSQKAAITDNTANFNRQTVRHSTGIYVSDSDFSLIETNIVNSNWRGIYLEYTSDTSIIDNGVSGNTLFGIHLYLSPRNMLANNNVDLSTGEWDSAGIYLSNSHENTISLNEVKQNLHGIILWESDYVHIESNDATLNGVGISLSSSDWAFVAYNNASYNSGTGISLSSSDHNEITENLAEWNKYGISLSSSSYNIIFNNIVRFNYFGISISWYSYDNEVIDNNAKSCRDYGAYLYRAYNNLVEHNDFSNSDSVGIYLERSDDNNIINSNATYAENYGINLFESNRNLINLNDARFSTDIGIELSSSNHNNLTNNAAELSDIGISIRFSINNRVQWNHVTDNDIGVYLLRSNDNKILDNDVSNNNNVGIDLSLSDFNVIAGNMANENPNYGIHLYSSEMNTIEGNSANLNGIGIYLDWSANNIIGGNTVTQNEFAGIAIYWSSDHNRIISNQVHSNMNISIRISSSNLNLIEGNNASLSGVGIFLDWSENNIIINNIADSNAYHGIVLEWFSDGNEVTNNSATGGLVGISLDMSSNNIVSYNNASLNKIGISLEWLSNNNNIFLNTMCNNQYHGISFSWESNYNLIRNNTIGYNNKYGVYVYESSNNTIYHNDILYNIDQAFDNAFNAWDNGYPTGGNYWSDYNGTDNYSGPNQNIPGSDGIGDTPYDIDPDSRDNYPLMVPHSGVVVAAFYVTPSSFSPSGGELSASGSNKKDTAIIRAKFTTRPDIQPIQTTDVEWILVVKTTITVTVVGWRGTGGTVCVKWDGTDAEGEVVPDGEYSIILQGRDKDGNPTWVYSTPITIDTEQPTITEVSDEPDPFNPSMGETTTINYTLSEKCYVTIKIYDPTGRLIKILRATQSAGPNSMTWDGKVQGLIVPDGTYTYEIHATDMAGNEATPVEGTITVAP